MAARSKSIQTIIAKRLIDNNSLAKLTDYLVKLPQTKDIHSNGNCYQPSRIALHDSIIADYLSRARCIFREKPIAIMTGGLPGSGKSTFIKRYANWLTNKSIFAIDADEIRAKLPEYQGWNAFVTHEETSDIIKRLLTLIGRNECRYDILFDGTMVNSKKYNELMNKFLQLGYDVYLIYITIPLELSIERALSRYQRSGRFVPLEIIYETASKGKSVFDELKKRATGWIEFDSVNQVIIGSGGYDLPANRDYTKLTALINGIKNRQKWLLK